MNNIMEEIRKLPFIKTSMMLSHSIYFLDEDEDIIFKVDPKNLSINIMYLSYFYLSKEDKKKITGIIQKYYDSEYMFNFK